MTTRFADTLAKEHRQTPVVRVYFWLDAKVPLWWITSTNQRYKVYVGQRVVKIHEICEQPWFQERSVQWRHVPGSDNPADLCTWELTSVAELLKQKDKWLQGPSWLKEDPESWPSPNWTQPNAHELPEEEEQPVATINALVGEQETHP